MKLLQKILFFLPFLALPLHAGALPPVIYVMDFDASKAQVSLGQDQPVTQVFTDIAAMTLSNELVKRLSKDVAPAQRITQRSQATAPGWLVTGSFQHIAFVNSITLTGYYKMDVTAVLTDLSNPGSPLGTFSADSSYYKGNESNAQAEGGDGATGPPPAPKSPGEQLAKGLSIDSSRAAARIVEQIRKWMSGN